MVTFPNMGLVCEATAGNADRDLAGTAMPAT
jgi:hypothetical protein